MAKLLVEEGIDVQAASTDGKTAIHYATQFGQEEIVRFLLRSDAKDLVNKADGSGWTPLHYAAEQGCLPLVESFLQVCSMFSRPVELALCQFQLVNYSE